MSTATRFTGIASRSLCLPRTPSRAFFTAIRPACTARESPKSRRLTSYRFFTMSSRQSAAPTAMQAREHDVEIKDIASYVHRTLISSDLAVCFLPHFQKSLTHESNSSILHDSSSSIRWAAVSKAFVLETVPNYSGPSWKVPWCPMGQESPERPSNSIQSMALSISAPRSGGSITMIAG